MHRPQGGPLSPLLANVLLDEVDKALEARGYSFARYADDCNVYVGSMRAGERVMAYLRKLYAKLQLQINEAKSAVASAFGRKFLGYALWAGKGREVKCAVAKKALDNFKARIRQLTRRTGGRSMSQVVEKLRPYLLGWNAYFGLAQTPGIWRTLDEWLRHRLRATQLRHWKRPKTIYRELKALGATEDVANQVAGNCHRWWRNSNGAIKRVMTIAYFERLGVPSLS
jgi:RNA-directed DNA polymerase